MALHRLVIMSKDGDWIIREDEEAALDAERRPLMHANEQRLGRYAAAAAPWMAAWRSVEKATANMPLLEAHAVIVKEAHGVLPPAAESTP